jgi:hypothetical protein
MDPKLSGAKTNPKVNPKNLEKQKKTPRKHGLGQGARAHTLGVMLSTPLGSSTPPSPTHPSAGAHPKPNILRSRQRTCIYFSSLMGSSTLSEPSAPLRIFLGPHASPSLFFIDHIYIILR